MFTYTRDFVKGVYLGYNYLFKNHKFMLVWCTLVNGSVVYTIVRLVKLIAHLV